jgi:hypothetical protein
MNWLEFFKLLVFFWPFIEKYLKGIKDEKEREREESDAIAAIMKMASEEKYA